MNRTRSILERACAAVDRSSVPTETQDRHPADEWQLPSEPPKRKQFPDHVMTEKVTQANRLFQHVDEFLNDRFNRFVEIFGEETGRDHRMLVKVMAEECSRNERALDRKHAAEMAALRNEMQAAISELRNMIGDRNVTQLRKVS